jgi:hypothetical protein
MRALKWIVPAVLCMACGGEKAEPKMEPKAPEPAPAASTATDTGKAAVRDTLKPLPDTATKKADRPLRDSAFGPKMAVDSTGKPVPLKKRP